MNILKLPGSAPTHRMPLPTASSGEGRAVPTTPVGTTGSGDRSTDIQVGGILEVLFLGHHIDFDVDF